MTINEYFDAVYVINLVRRPDRLEHVKEECRKHSLNVEVFVAADTLTWGNHGCTLSHRLVMEQIADKQLSRVLVLEDDFKVVCENLNKSFSDMIGLVPEDWDILYLGGHYAEKPVSRVNGHVIRCGQMKTTSSYGITLQQAERMSPTLIGAGPIDEWFSMWNLKSKSYVFQPRLIVQYNNYSDLQQHDCNNEPCMMDTSHEQMV